MIGALWDIDDELPPVRHPDNFARLRCDRNYFAATWFEPPCERRIARGDNLPARHRGPVDAPPPGLQCSAALGKVEKLL